MAKTKIVNDLSQMIEPHFSGLWWTDKPYIMAKGGRGSMKSSTISLKLVVDMMRYVSQGHTANAICLRENDRHLHDSVYNQIRWAINMLHIGDQFFFGKTPMIIRHRASGSAFYFYGANDPERLKSNIIGNVFAMWWEEAVNVKNEKVFADTNPTFVRQKPGFVPVFKIYYSFNPNINVYDWSNDWVTKCEQDPSFYVDHSTYLDDKMGFTSDDTLRLIDTVKRNDEGFYKWQYLGQVVGLGTNIYNMSLFKRMDSIPDDDSIETIFFGADTGHAVSADAVPCFGMLSKRDKNGLPRIVLLDMYYYSPANKTRKKSPSEVSKEIYDFVERMVKQYNGCRPPYKFTMDSAEAALRNQMYADYGIVWHPVNKYTEATMIEYVQSLLAQGRFYYMPTETVMGYFIPQHEQYRWDEKTMQSDEPRVIKVDDHCPDAFKYFVIDNRLELGLAD